MLLVYFKRIGSVYIIIIEMIILVAVIRNIAEEEKVMHLYVQTVELKVILSLIKMVIIVDDFN